MPVNTGVWLLRDAKIFMCLKTEAPPWIRMAVPDCIFCVLIPHGVVHWLKVEVFKVHFLKHIWRQPVLGKDQF